MFTLTIIAFVLIGLTIITSYVISKPSLREIEELSKKELENDINDHPSFEDHPIAIEQPTIIEENKTVTKKRKKKN